MADFDFEAALRWARLQPKRTLAHRPDDVLPFVGSRPQAGMAILLDTCVYIDGLQGRAPDTITDLLDIRSVNHSTVAVQELMHTVGVLDPAHPGTRAAIRQIGSLIKSMRPHRLFTPDADILGRGALLAGILCRFQGYGVEHRLRALQDCVLFVQAQKLGLSVLTANVRDFDLLLQVMPAGRALFYRRR